MGIGHRVFFFDKHGVVKQIPVSIYEGLNRGRKVKPLTEYAGQRVRYVSLFLEVKNRKPIKILSADNGYIQFDAAGKVDPSDIDVQVAETGKIMNAIISQKPGDVLSELKPDLAALQYKDRFKWEITPEEIRQIGKLVFR